MAIGQLAPPAFGDLTQHVCAAIGMADGQWAEHVARLRAEKAHSEAMREQERRRREWQMKLERHRRAEDERNRRTLDAYEAMRGPFDMPPGEAVDVFGRAVDKFGRIITDHTPIADVFPEPAPVPEKKKGPPKKKAYLFEDGGKVTVSTPGKKAERQAAIQATKREHLFAMRDPWAVCLDPGRPTMEPVHLSALGSCD